MMQKLFYRITIHVHYVHDVEVTLVFGFNFNWIKQTSCASVRHLECLHIRLLWNYLDFIVLVNWIKKVYCNIEF